MSFENIIYLIKIQNEMKIYIIDNGGQWTHREWRTVRDLGVDSTIVPNTVDADVLADADGIILSGGPASIESEMSKLGNIKEYMHRYNYPVLGICVGAQFIAIDSGGRVSKALHAEYGKKIVNFTSKDGIFYNVPDSINAWENHNDEIKSISDDYIICAYSDTCRVQAFYHKNRDIFGVQFHPEVNNTEHGTTIFKNFIEKCRR
ncbi:GMP synthase (glutamine-hydrolysing) [Picrophilus oshimae DSM 9789]|uniref:GMP synthase [glutamine-hydrolyzing] subunit A n=2 Tax=Picrophilus oshimae TaxID=46632 RepID=A0A8G2L7H5_PICTO|nr:GMP synthase (glutamine-hydrolysing) [Picrophilus oshimae DSM 9789]